MKRFLLALLTIAMVPIGTMMYVCWGYKNGWFFVYVPLVLLCYGWIGVLIIAAVFHPVAKKKDGSPRARSFAHKLYFLVYLLVICLCIENCLSLGRWKSDHIAKVLSTAPAANTVALVVRIEEDWNKSGVH